MIDNNFGHETEDIAEGRPIATKVFFSPHGDPNDYVLDGGGHHHGRVMSVLRARYVRYGWGALLAFGGAFFVAYAFFINPEIFSEVDSSDSTYLIMAIAAIVVFIGLGLYWLYCATRRVVFRQTGFETKSLFKTKAYDYKDVSFRLYDTYEHRTDSAPYSPVFFKMGNFYHIWICEGVIRGEIKPLLIKSSQYGFVKTKCGDVCNKRTELVLEDQ